MRKAELLRGAPEWWCVEFCREIWGLSKVTWPVALPLAIEAADFSDFSTLLLAVLYSNSQWCFWCFCLSLADFLLKLAWMRFRMLFPRFLFLIEKKTRKAKISAGDEKQSDFVSLHHLILVMSSLTWFYRTPLPPSKDLKRLEFIWNYFSGCPWWPISRKCLGTNFQVGGRKVFAIKVTSKTPFLEFEPIKWSLVRLWNWSIFLDFYDIFRFHL